MEEVADAEEVAFTKFRFEDADQTTLNYGGDDSDGDEHHRSLDLIEFVDIFTEAVVGCFEVGEGETGNKEEGEEDAEGGGREGIGESAESVFIGTGRFVSWDTGFGEVEVDPNEVDESKES